ncbi:MAG: hypothetical protein AAF682_03000 [Planctomycetota bacterium]
MREPEEELQGPAERERLERELSAPLEAWAQRERAAAKDAEKAATAADAELARQVFEGLSHRPRGHPLRRYGFVAAVIAAGLLVWLGFGRPAEETAGPKVFLGSGEGRLRRPVGEVLGYDEFQWDASGEDIYALRIWSGDDLKPTVAVDALLTNSYLPTPAELELLGEEIRWEVHVLDDADRFLRILGSAEARLRSR